MWSSIRDRDISFSDNFEYAHVANTSHDQLAQEYWLALFRAMEGPDKQMDMSSIDVRAQTALSARSSSPAESRSTDPGNRKERQRTGHACEPCRRRRAKCNGAQPRCGRCEELAIPCFYAESKAQRHQKEKLLSSKASMYEALLRSLIPLQDQATQKQIRAALGTDRTAQTVEKKTKAKEEGKEPVQDETVARGSAGSPAQQGTSCDISQAEGFLGKSSSVRWMSDIDHQFHQNSPSEIHHRAPSAPQSAIQGMLADAATYHVNDFDHEVFSNFMPDVDLKYIPPRSVADNYLRLYLETIHPYFQVVEEKQFTLQYDRFYMTGLPPEGGALWQAMLNLIFALGSLREKYLGYQTEDSDDIQFFVRARMLSLEPLNLLQLPERSHVQLTAMFTMYLLASNRINRAWLMIGTSVRYAQNLGLHLSNVDDHVEEFDKELQKRLWHSVLSMENLLCFLTGRPLSVLETTSSVALPTDSDNQEQGRAHLNWGAIQQDVHPEDNDRLETFRKGILLDRIVAEILTELYSAATVNKIWADIQHSMAELNIKLSTWRAYLPDRFGLRDMGNRGQIHHSSRTTYLALRYYSVSILINRLSLCYHNGSMQENMPDQSHSSREIDIDNGKRAIAAAQSLLQVLAQHEPWQLYAETPWWCVLHYIVQGCALLIMEIADNSQHVPNNREEILTDARRGIKMLHQMRTGDPAAEKAFQSLTRLLEHAISKRTGRDRAAALSRETSSSSAMGSRFDPVSGIDAMDFTTAEEAPGVFTTLHGPNVWSSTPILSPFVNWTMVTRSQ